MTGSKVAIAGLLLVAAMSTIIRIDGRTCEDVPVFLLFTVVPTFLCGVAAIAVGLLMGLSGNW